VNWEIEGQVALVTGAGAGIGAAISRHLSCAGATVWGADTVWPDPTDSEIQRIDLDVTDGNQVDEVMRKVADDAGRIDILVNNAGAMRAREFFEYELSDWHHIYSVNAFGLFSCIQAAAAIMAREGSGSIVNIASTAGRTGRTLSPPYASSKAAVINITRSASLLLAGSGIRVNAVCPGLIDTNFNRRLGEQLGPALGLTPEEHLAKRAEGIPLSRVGTADDVAAAVCFLASPRASYITGQSINVDGGVVLS
jgi:NAD(P)-dependent dehydrogenase (short-subunit alcohol dehydrogenase family)